MSARVFFWNVGGAPLPPPPPPPHLCNIPPDLGKAYYCLSRRSTTIEAARRRRRRHHFHPKTYRRSSHRRLTMSAAARRGGADGGGVAQGWIWRAESQAHCKRSVPGFARLQQRRQSAEPSVFLHCLAILEVCLGLTRSPKLHFRQLSQKLTKAATF